MRPFTDAWVWSLPGMTTVGTAIERYSYEYRRPRGVYLSVDAPEEI